MERDPITLRRTCGILAVSVLALGLGGAARAPRPAPRFSLPAEHGTVTLDSLRGKTVWVDFWASWCDPCRHSFPWMDSLKARYGPRGLEIVAIDLDKDRDEAEAFLEAHPARFPVVFDPAGVTADAFGVAAMPTSYLIGPNGDILLVHAGFDPRKTAPLERAIEEALPR